jgi:hypothetical protein
MRYLASVMRFVVIVIIYIILYRIIRTMYLDLKAVRNKEEEEQNFALELLDCPDTVELNRGSVYPVRDIINIGRKDDNHLVLNDPFISSYHASLFVQDGRLVLKDLNSTNGTFKNGRKVKDQVELSDGDEFKVGRILFKVIG